MAFDHRHAMAAEDHSVAGELAVRSCRCACWPASAVKSVAAEPLCPVRRQRGVGRAGHRVLVDAVIGDEDAAGDVLLVAGRGDDRHVGRSRQRLESRARRRGPPLRRRAATMAASLQPLGQPDRAVRKSQRRAQRRVVGSRDSSAAAGRAAAGRLSRVTVRIARLASRSGCARRAAAHGRMPSVAWPHSSTSTVGVNQRRS